MEKCNLKKKAESRVIQKRTIKGRPFIDNRPTVANLSKLVSVISNNPIQRAMKYGNVQELIGASGRIHWHYAYDDTQINSLHVTVCDTANYNVRTWASRKRYTPTSTTSGTWSGWVNNHGTTPVWALDLVNSRDPTTSAETAFHDNADIRAMLHTAFPPPPLDLGDLSKWPSL